MGWVVNATHRPLYPRERDPVPTVQEARWAPGPVWTGAENLAPTGFRSPDRPARSQSLYWISNPGPRIIVNTLHKVIHNNNNNNNNNNNKSRMCNVTAKVIPVTVGSTGTISKSLRQHLSNMPGTHEIKELQKTAIMGTAHILREVLM
jgi:hypothetical protein